MSHAAAARQQQKCISRRGSDGAILAHWSRRENMGPWSGLISVHWANQQFRLSGSWNMCARPFAWYERAADEDPTPADYCICVRPFSQKKIKSREEKKNIEPSINSINSFFIIRLDFFSSIVHVGWMEELSRGVAVPEMLERSELAKSLENSNLIPKARIKILGMFSTINHQLKIFFALPQSLWNNHLNLNKIIKISKKREEKKRICMNLI